MTSQIINHSPINFAIAKFSSHVETKTATETCIDLALHLRRPFAVCPCCVFPQPGDFDDRKLEEATLW